MYIKIGNSTQAWSLSFKIWEGEIWEMQGIDKLTKEKLQRQ
jgi:hypothetical protein